MHRHYRIAVTFFIVLAALESLSFAQGVVTLQSVTPVTVMAGSSDLPITVTGSGFTSASVIIINGQALATTVIDATRLQAVVPASLLVASTALSVNVQTPGSPFPVSLSLYVASPSSPVVTSVASAGGTPGSTVRVFLTGTNLNGTSLTFSGRGLTVQPAVGSQSFAVSIASDAPIGPQAMTVTTLSGSTNMCGGRPCTFTVIPLGSWTNVPAGAAQAANGLVTKLLDGRVLWIGEMDEPSTNGQSTIVSSVQLFDPVTLQWQTRSPMKIARRGVITSLLPDGRLLAAGGNNAAGPLSTAEIYDPSSDTWILSGSTTLQSPSQALLLPTGKVLLTSNSDAQLFDPNTGTFQPAPQVVTQSSLYGIKTVLLADGRILVLAIGGGSSIYDPVTQTSSAGPLISRSFFQLATLLPDGRVLVQGDTIIGPFAPTPDFHIYDPRTNSVTPAALNEVGTQVLLPNGMVLVTGTFFGLAGTLGGDAVLYDPVGDQQLDQPIGTPPVEVATLLDDGRVFGVNTQYSSSDPANSGTFAQVYTPPASAIPAPAVGAVISNDAPGTQVLALDIRGTSFVPNSSVWLGQTKVVTLYLGSQHLVAFVPPALRSSLSSGIAVNNPGPGGGATSLVPVGYVATAPLPITEVESGPIRTGYAVVTADFGSAVPIATLTYGSVSNGIVESQAAVLPTPLTTQTSIAVDVLQGIGRNLGLAIANPTATAAQITLTLLASDGTNVASTTFSLPANAQIPRFVTELLPAGSVGNVFQGSVSVQSSIAVSIVAFRFSGSAFSTVQIPVTSPAAGSNTIVFPQFAMSGGWATRLDLVNNGSTPISGRIDIFDSNGKPLVIPWNNQHNSTFTYTIPPHGTLFLSPRDANGQSPF